MVERSKGRDDVAETTAGSIGGVGRAVGWIVFDLDLFVKLLVCSCRLAYLCCFLLGCKEEVEEEGRKRKRSEGGSQRMDKREGRGWNRRDGPNQKRGGGEKEKEKGDGGVWKKKKEKPGRQTERVSMYGVREKEE